MVPHLLPLLGLLEEIRQNYSFKFKGKAINSLPGSGSKYYYLELSQGTPSFLFQRWPRLENSIRDKVYFLNNKTVTLRNY